MELMDFSPRICGQCERAEGCKLLTLHEKGAKLDGCMCGRYFEIKRRLRDERAAWNMIHRGGQL